MFSFKYKILLIIVLFAMSTPVLYADEGGNQPERDPFTPFTFVMEDNLGLSTDGKKNKSDSLSNLSPTINYPLSSYRILGTIISDKKSVVVVKARDHSDYYLTMDEAIGNEGGKIRDINAEGIVVDVKGRIIPLKVRNRFEVIDGIH